MMTMVILQDAYDTMYVCMCERHFKAYVAQKPGSYPQTQECDQDIKCDMCASVDPNVFDEY